MKRARRRASPAAPPPLSVPDLVRAPELAAVVLLEHALDVVTCALIAEHPTLVSEFNIPREQGAVVTLAHLICAREAVLRETLWRYRHAVRDAAVGPVEKPRYDDEDLF